MWRLIIFSLVKMISNFVVGSWITEIWNLPKLKWFVLYQEAELWCTSLPRPALAYHLRRDICNRYFECPAQSPQKSFPSGWDGFLPQAPRNLCPRIQDVLCLGLGTEQTRGAGELIPQGSPPPRTDGGWCINTPASSPLGASLTQSPRGS